MDTAKDLAKKATDAASSAASTAASAASSAVQTGGAQLSSLRYGLPSGASAPLATAEDEAVRQSQGFPEVEASLPKAHELTGAATTADSAGPSSSDTPLLDRILAFALGDKNPAASAANAKDDVVWLFDNAAYRPDGERTAHWEAEFIAAMFVRYSGKDLSGAVANIADKIGVDDGKVGAGKEEVRKRIEERLRPFALGIRPARWVDLKWDGTVGEFETKAATGSDGDDNVGQEAAKTEKQEEPQLAVPSASSTEDQTQPAAEKADGESEVRRLGPGDSNGIMSQTLGQLGFRKAGEVVHSCPLDAQLAPHGPMSTFFVEPEGWTVISDIDDSIKITMTSSPIGMLQSTFYDEPTPITGMPELYKHIESKLQPNWFYLSASPYNLYTFLRPFLREHYPHGPLFLRDASWQDLNGLLQSFTVGTEAYKSSRIERIHEQLPLKKVLCVGDSTQSDPEAYGAMYRKYPGWIKAIFIRKVTGVKGMDATKKNAPERFDKAFKDVAKDVWHVFEDPAELHAAVDALTNTA